LIKICSRAIDAKTSLLAAPAHWGLPPRVASH
jgi:hypothetical protein